MGSVENSSAEATVQPEADRGTARHEKSQRQIVPGKGNRVFKATEWGKTLAFTRK